MANHKSALKRIRQSERRRKRNQHIRTQMRTMVKYCREAFESGDQTKATDAFKVAEREIRRAATKGVIPRKQASRRISRLSKANNRQGSAS